MLLHYGTWKFIEKTEKNDIDKPPAKTKETAAGVTKPEKEKLPWREKQDLKLRRNQDYTSIYQSLSSQCKSLISITTDGAMTWQILHDHFESTKAPVIQHLDDFSNTRYVPRENLGLPMSCQENC